TALSSVVLVRPVITIAAPSSPRRREIARPIPRPPPVTTATFPERGREFMMQFLQNLVRHVAWRCQLRYARRGVRDAQFANMATSPAIFQRGNNDLHPNCKKLVSSSACYDSGAFL